MRATGRRGRDITWAELMTINMAAEMGVPVFCCPRAWTVRLFLLLPAPLKLRDSSSVWRGAGARRETLKY
ncbi:hypothetical protein FKM82_025064 [Ascaphus truei]